MKRFYNLYNDIKAKLQEETGAVTLTERFRAHIGHRAFRIHECVLAAGSNPITAASMDLNFVDASWISPMVQTLSAGSTSGMVLKYGAASSGITISGVDSASDKCMIFAVGW